MEEAKALVTIKGKEYKIRFTIGFWKEMQENFEITQANIESKLQETFALAGDVVLCGIKYGMPADFVIDITLEDILRELDHSISDVIEAAIINNMTKAEKRAVDIIKKAQEKKMKEIEDGNDKPKNDL